MGQSSLADLPPHSAVRLCLTVEPLPDYWRLRLRFIRRSLMKEINTQLSERRSLSALCGGSAAWSSPELIGTRPDQSGNQSRVLSGCIWGWQDLFRSFFLAGLMMVEIFAKECGKFEQVDPVAKTPLDSLTTHVHYGPALRILLRLAQHFVCDRGCIAFAEGDVLQQV